MDIKEAFIKMNDGHNCICVNDTYQYRIRDDQLEYKSKFGHSWDYNGSVTNSMVQSEWTLVDDILSDKILNTSDMDIDIEVLLVEDVEKTIFNIKNEIYEYLSNFGGKNEIIDIINKHIGNKFEVD